MTVRNGLAQGFDTFLDHPSWTDTDAQAVNRLFFDWLDGREPSQPFFAMLWYVDPHTPYEPPREIVLDLLDERQQALVSERTIRPGSHELSDEEMAVTKQLYRGEVMSFDREFGTLMRELRRRRLLDSTVVVFTSDHGESFWEHTDIDNRPLVGHGVSMFRTEIAVPLMMRFPGGRNAQKIASRVSTMDIAPSVLGALRLEDSEDAFRGRDLMRLVRDGSRETDAPPALSELYTDFNNTVNFHIESISTDAGKLVVTYRYRGRALEPVATRLFDAADRPLDPATHQTLRAELERSLDAWRASLAPLPSVPVDDIARENELIERLRALGYLR